LADWGPRWDKVSQISPASFDMKTVSKMPESLKNCLLSGIRMIMCSDKISWSRKFGLFLRAMTQLELLSRRQEFGMQMLCTVVKQFSAKIWIIPFLLFSGAVADAIELLPEAERLVWMKFESCILIVLREDAESLAMYANQRRQLGAEFELIRRKGK